MDSRKPYVIALASFCIFFLSGCITKGSLTRNSAFFPTPPAHEDTLSYNNFRVDILPQLQAGIGKASEEEIRALFSRDPDAEQDIIDGTPVLFRQSVFINNNPSMKSDAGQLSNFGTGAQLPDGKLLVLRGLAYYYAPTKNREIELPVLSSDKKELESYYVLLAFLDGKLWRVEMKKEKDVWNGISWTTKKIVDGVIQTAMYAAPGVALGIFLRESAKDLSGSLRYGSDKIAGSVDNMSGSVNNVAGSINNSGLSNLGNLVKPGSSFIGTITLPNGQTATGTFSVPK